MNAARFEETQVFDDLVTDTAKRQINVGFDKAIVCLKKEALSTRESKTRKYLMDIPCE